MTICSTRSWPAAALSTLMAVACAGPLDQVEPDYIAAMAQAQGAHRLIEPRLTGGFQWAPCEPSQELRARGRCEDSPDPENFYETGARLHQETVETPTLLHAQGVWDLIWEKPDAAVVKLQRAAELASDGSASQRAAIASDLAACLLARQAASGDPEDLHRALEAATRATELDPSLPEARFNLALSLDRLVLWITARETDEKYLALDYTSGWADEIRELHERQAGIDLGAEWVVAQQALKDDFESGDREAFDATVSRFSGTVGAWIEGKLLPAWASETLEDPGSTQAESQLALIRALAQALQDGGHDALPRDAVALVDSLVASGDTAALRRLQEAHRDYPEALGAYWNKDYTRANELFGLLADRLSEAGSPYALWARYYAAEALHYSDSGVGEGAFLALREEIGPRDYPSLLGWIDSMLGLSRFKAGDYQGALDAYQSAQSTLEQAGDLTASTAQAGVANAQRGLGQNRLAWENRLAAMARISSIRNVRGLHPVLVDDLWQLVEDDRLIAAGWVGQELVANADIVKEPSLLTEAHLFHARVLRRLGGSEEVAIELAEARTALDDLPVGDFRTLLEAQLEIEEAETSLATAPAAARASLTHDLEVFRERGRFERLPRILMAGARASRLLGEPGAAREDLRQAMNQVEQQREWVKLGWDRIAYFETVQDIYDERIAFELQEGQSALAFASAEAARGRVLRDEVTLRSGLAEGDTDLSAGYPLAPSLKRLQKDLPQDAALIEMALLPHRLVVWVVTREGLQTTESPLDPAELSDLVARFRLLLQTDPEATETRELATRLGSELVEPWRRHVAGREVLVLVPDRVLHQVPFAALVAASTGRRLVEDFTLVSLPAASFVQPRTAKLEPIAAGLALMLGDPEIPYEKGLPLLASARAEAQALGRLWGRDAIVLTGAEATEATFRSLAPQARVIHVAGHARFDPLRPLDSDLLLAPDPGGEQDGRLTVPEIYGLDLSKTDLVILAACRTTDLWASGEREGLAGLARAFFAAGADAVIASSWPVEDRATSRLMESLHRHLAAGLDPARALRAAQLELLDNPSGHEPAVWASFQILGGAHLLGGPKE